MALFGNKKTKEKGADATSKEAVIFHNTTDHMAVLRNPRITEKASEGMEKGIYVFDVARKASKQQIKAAIKRVYNVDAARVHVARIPTKNTRNVRTGIGGTKGGGKKAYVYLKKGDQISIM